MDPSTFFPGRQNAMIIVQTAVLISDFIGHLVRILTRPVYQRDFNWNERKVSNFLLTIMTSGYVQPLLLYEYGDEDEKIEGNDSEIIDGQHRALSIQAFMTGEPIIDKKGKSIMAYLKHEGHYLFYAKHDTEDNPIKKWEDETGNKPTYFTKEQQKKFRDYKLRLETCNSRLTLERRRSLFDSLQEGVPVRNSDKDKNNMGCAVVNELNTDYPTWESDYKTNYMPLLTSCAVQNRLYCVVRLYAIFVDPDAGRNKDKFWTDKEIKDKIANNSLLPRGRAGEFKAKMDEVYETMRQLKELKPGAKYTPIQLFTLCVGVFNDARNLVEKCASYITVKGKKKKNTAVTENKDTKSWWFDERYRDVESDVMAYYHETRSFLESSAPPPPPPPEPPSGPRKWGACTPKNVWRHYFSEHEEGNCSFDFCNKALTRKGKWERGHDIPHSKGGSSSDMSNLYVVCKDCNRKQGTQTRAEFERSQMHV